MDAEERPWAFAMSSGVMVTVCPDWRVERRRRASSRQRSGSCPRCCENELYSGWRTAWVALGRAR